VLVFSHTERGTQVTPDGASFLLSHFLPPHVRDEITHGSLILQPLSVETRDLGYVLFEEAIPERFVGELLRTDLSRAIDSLHRSQRQAQSVESSVALRTEELRRTNNELLKLTKLDGLTGIANRAAFDSYIQEQWAAHLTDGCELSILLIDVDHFKEHNDRYGHVDGDKCLRRLAQSIRESVWSPVDLAARYGGDEFIVVLPHTDATGASAVAQRVHDSLAVFKSSSAGAVTPLFTVSIGVATIRPRPSMNPTEFVALADAALYAAKSGGRDRIATALDPETSPRP
jgi:diguanylate cyclase (GGDEF)-like protein